MSKPTGSANLKGDVLTIKTTAKRGTKFVPKSQMYRVSKEDSGAILLTKGELTRTLESEAVEFLATDEVWQVEINESGRPECSCPHKKFHHSPCKHTLACIRPVVERLKEIGAAIWNVVGPALEDIGERIGGMFDGINMGPVNAMIGQFVEMLRAAAPVAVKLAGFVADVVGWVIKAAMAAVDFVNSLGGIDVVIGAIIGALSVVASLLAPFVIAAAAIALAFLPCIIVLTAIGAALAAIGYVIYRVVKAVWPLIEAVGKVASAVFKVGAILMGTVFEAFGKILGLKSGLSSIGAIFESWIELIGKVAEWIATTLVSSVKTLIDLLANVADRMASMFERLPAIMQRQLGITAQQMRNMAADLRRVSAGMNEQGTQQQRRQGQQQGRTDVSSVGGQFEDAMQLFKRINEAAIKTQAERTNEILTQQVALQTQMAASLGLIAGQQQGDQQGNTPPVAPPGGVSPLLFGAGGMLLNRLINGG